MRPGSKGMRVLEIVFWLLCYVFRVTQWPAAPAGQHPQDKAGIAAALADTEFAIRAEEATNTLFARWRFLHILLGCLIFALLALHVGAAIYYGLRWL